MNVKRKKITAYILMLAIIILPMIKFSIQISDAKGVPHSSHCGYSKSTHPQSDSDHADSLVKKGVCCSCQINAVFNSYVIGDIPMLLCGVLFMILLPLGLPPIYRLFKPPRLMLNCA